MPVAIRATEYVRSPVSLFIAPSIKPRALELTRAICSPGTIIGSLTITLQAQRTIRSMVYLSLAVRSTLEPVNEKPWVIFPLSTFSEANDFLYFQLFHRVAFTIPTGQVSTLQPTIKCPMS
jgi:hypothetical protein